MATIYFTDGTTKQVEPKNKKGFSLAEMQAIVGGLIELLHLSNSKIMVINEEGKINGLPINANATDLVFGCRHPFDIVVGNVLVCNNNQIR